MDSLWNIAINIEQPNAEFLKIVFAVIGGAFALWKWRADVKAKRSLEFHQLIKDVQNDKNIKKLLYTFDDDTKSWFLEDIVGDDIFAPILDKLLFHFCYVIYLKKNKIITKGEFSTLSYEIDRSLQNPQLQDYLYNLKMYSEERGLQHPYKYLVDYGIDKKILDDVFAGDHKKTKEKQDWLKKPLRFHEYYKRWLNDEKIYRKSYNRQPSDEAIVTTAKNDKGV